MLIVGTGVKVPRLRLLVFITTLCNNAGHPNVADSRMLSSVEAHVHCRS